MGPSMPDLNNNNRWLNKYPLSAAVEHQAQSLIKPPALPHFKQVRYTEVSTLGRSKYSWMHNRMVMYANWKIMVSGRCNV
jgi:hypothetical protein